jgi:hypothetical protein
MQSKVQAIQPCQEETAIAIKGRQYPASPGDSHRRQTIFIISLCREGPVIAIEGRQ